MSVPTATFSCLWLFSDFSSSFPCLQTNPLFVRISSRDRAVLWSATLSAPWHLLQMARVDFLQANIYRGILAHSPLLNYLCTLSVQGLAAATQFWFRAFKTLNLLFFLFFFKYENIIRSEDPLMSLAAARHTVTLPVLWCCPLLGFLSAVCSSWSRFCGPLRRSWLLI